MMQLWGKAVERRHNTAVTANPSAENIMLNFDPLLKKISLRADAYLLIAILFVAQIVGGSAVGSIVPPFGGCHLSGVALTPFGPPILEPYLKIDYNY